MIPPVGDSPGCKIDQPYPPPSLQPQCRQELALFTCAFVLLFLYTVSSLALPNYQGEIIDKVADDDETVDKRKSWIAKQIEVADEDDPPIYLHDVHEMFTDPNAV